jgi:tripartite-type tricarboxylate transporter receptor subunit TctC
VPLKGGGDVANALADKQVDLTVNNPIEAEPLWRAGKVRPLCVFDGARLAYPAKLSHGASWGDLPTCMSAGIPVQYLMLRGIFTTPGATPEQVAFYRKLLEQVSAQPEWRDYLARGALKPTAMSGQPFLDWLDRTDNFHRVLMRESRLNAR